MALTYDWMKIPRRIRVQIIADVEGEYKKVPYKYWVTELCGCLPAAYYSRTLESSKKMDPDNIRDIEKAYSFWRGKMHDIRLSEPFPYKQLSCMMRVPGIPVTISGKADILWDHEDGDKIIELKTIKSMYYRNREGKPSSEHTKQVVFYAYHLTPTAKIAQIQYWDMGGCLAYDVDLKLTKTIIPWFVKRAQILYKALEDGTPPEKDIKDTWEGRKCRDYCEYKKECKKNE